MNLLTFPGDIGIWMVEFITLSQRWNGLANLFLQLRTWRCSDCSSATLCGCLVLLSNGNWSITVLLNKGPFWSPASCLCTVFPCLRLFCKAARFVTDGTIPFPLHSFCYLWALSHQPSLPGKKKEGHQKAFNTSRGNILLSIPRHCCNTDNIDKNILGTYFFLNLKVFSRRRERYKYFAYCRKKEANTIK